MHSEDTFNSLRRQGYRLTPARKAIITWILDCPRPFLSKELITGIDNLNITVNDSTVYRELNFLIRQGLVKTLTLESGNTHYESALTDHHHHLYCVACRSIQDIMCNKSAVFEIENQAIQQGFKITNHQIEFQGICRKCSSSN